MNPLPIGKRLLGDGQPCFLAFEVGPTLTGFDSAMELLAVTQQAGADALKVQILNADKLVGDPALEVGWTEANGTVWHGPLCDILRRRALTDEQWATLAHATHAAGLAFIATVDFRETLALAVKIGADAIKVCSGDVNNAEWIAEVARAGLPLMLDTGHATLGEVERAVDACLAAGNDRVVIHVNPSGYPGRLESINLRLLPTLWRVFPELVIGFSDHNVGRDMDAMAVALGAAMIEKTLTLDRTQAGPEHMFSLEPHEAAGFVQAMRELEVALGRPRRVLTDAERVARRAARRSPFTTRALAAGERVGDDDIEWRRPAGGIEPPDWPLLKGRRVVRDLSAGQMLRLEDLA